MQKAETTLMLVDDDEKLTSLLAQYLTQQGYHVLTVSDGITAINEITEKSPALVVLDLMLPGKDGLSVCREVRSVYQGKILMMTARDDDMDQVAGLEIGADDYVVKPVQPRVLLARIRTLLRRLETETSSPSNSLEKTEKTSNELRYGKLFIHLIKRKVQIEEKSIVLTETEFKLLWLLASHPEEVLTREHILKSLRGIEYDGIDRYVDVKIAILRKKLGDNPAMPTRIITIRGKGYLFVPDSWD